MTTTFEAVIKINPSDLPTTRATHIADGIGYACALLHDEYGWTTQDVADLLKRVTDDVADDEAQRSDD